MVDAYTEVVYYSTAGIFLSIVGPFVDYAATGVHVVAWVQDNYDLPLITGIVVTSVLGVLVNITAYWAIKTTGAVTYQVRQCTLRPRSC